jgi:cephalosporin hydroxylase
LPIYKYINMDEIRRFKEERTNRIKKQGASSEIQAKAAQFTGESIKSGYSYNFSWMGRPIIQYPQDMIAMQELVWEIKPDLIIETGIAHGGSLIYYASLLELIGHGEVVGIDIDIRAHNRKEIESHSLFKRIRMIEGSSTSEDVVDQIREMSAGKKGIMVCLDSNHTHDHVLKELNLYAPFVSLGSYLIAFDTIVEDLPAQLIQDRPWSKGNNPKTAVWEFLKNNDHFEVDTQIDDKLLISVAPQGYLKRVK